VLATDRCTPNELNLVAVKLQSTVSHPVGYSLITAAFSLQSVDDDTECEACLKLSAQLNETETKQFQNCFETN